MHAHEGLDRLDDALGIPDQVATGLTPADADRYLIRDAQRVIEAIESLVRMHNAQEEDIYEHAVAA